MVVNPSLASTSRTARHASSNSGNRAAGRQCASGTHRSTASASGSLAQQLPVRRHARTSVRSGVATGPAVSRDTLLSCNAAGQPDGVHCQYAPRCVLHALVKFKRRNGLPRVTSRSWLSQTSAGTDATDRDVPTELFFQNEHENLALQVRAPWHHLELSQSMPSRAQARSCTRCLTRCAVVSILEL